MTVNAAEWADLKAAFAELVELGPAERSARLASMDPARAAALRTLLRADEDVDARLEELEPEPIVLDDDPLGLCGSDIAQFRITRVLGRGGMGIAYAAEDTRLGRAVALKFLLPQYAGDAFARARRERTPVLLSITAAWCRWCREMDRTSYADAAVVDAIARSFVPVRVDADRRPDLWERYGGVGE